MNFNVETQSINNSDCFAMSKRRIYQTDMHRKNAALSVLTRKTRKAGNTLQSLEGRKS